MSKEVPDHHDAELVLRLYELRGEPVMRESRNAMLQFMPRTWDEFIAATQCETGRQRLELVQARLRKMLEAPR